MANGNFLKLTVSREGDGGGNCSFYFLDVPCNVSKYFPLCFEKSHNVSHAVLEKLHYNLSYFSTDIKEGGGISA